MTSRIAAEVGGTFIDVILLGRYGRFNYRKVFATAPAYDLGVVSGVSELLPEAASSIAEVIRGTTVATNAVLERRGALTAFVTTAERFWRTLAPKTSLQVRSDRQRHRPNGLMGGEEGAPSGNWLSDDVGTGASPPMFSTSVSEGTLYRHRMASGGGWGEPLDRDPDAVANDVRNEKVSLAAAEERYGVVLREDGCPDVRRTDELRERLRLDRKENVDDSDPRI